MKKKNLFVTAADRNYIEKAKQVFAGAYFNAGWRGDYMLLAHDVPEKELVWFRKKGILVKHCQPLFRKQMGVTPSSYFTRLHLFKTDFKKWSKVIYVDTDVVIRSSLEDLIKIKHFGAVLNYVNYHDHSLRIHFINDSEIRERGLTRRKYFDYRKNLEKKFDLSQDSFCDGVFVFDSSLIKNNTFNKLKRLVLDFYPISRFAEESALNLYFYRRWEKLSPVYDFYINRGKNPWFTKPAKIRASIMHFQGPDKPWNKKNRFYGEWKQNFQISDKINLDQEKIGKVWAENEIEKITFILNVRGWIVTFIFKFIRGLTEAYYKVLLFLENKFPKQFFYLKHFKKKLLSR